MARNLTGLILGRGWNKGTKGIMKSNSGSFKTTPKELHPRWAGGLPKCNLCVNLLSTRHSKTGLCKKCWTNSAAFKQISQKGSRAASAMKGPLHHNWKDGSSTNRHRLMGQKEYKLWRTSVFCRDSYTCQSCGISGNRSVLNADHIKPWATNPKLRYKIENGRTLCVECHYKTDTWGYKAISRKEACYS